MKPITSLQHPLVKHLHKLRTSSSYRHAQKRALIVGQNLVKEIPIKTLLVVGEPPKGLKFEECFIVTESIMKKITGLEAPEGIAAEVELPPLATLKNKKHVLVLDGVSDPGNMGTLLRTALALGWDGAYILHNSCDPYNDKALRAAKGATFRLPLRTGNWEELIELIKENKLEPIAADMGGKDVSSEKSKQIALVVGNEAHGLSEEARKFCTKVAIPMSGEMESLNVAVAGGILMYCLVNQ